MKLKNLGIVLALTVSCVSLAACGTKDNGGNNNTQPATQQTEAATQGMKDVACADLEKAVAAALGDNYYPNTAIEDVEHLGLTKEMYTDFTYAMPMISMNADTLVIVKAADGKVKDVEAALNAYRDMLIADQMQYPSNLVKIHNSMVKVYGDYVAFIQLGGDVDSIIIAATEKNPNLSEDETDKIGKDAVVEQNNLAAQAIENALLGK